MNSRFSSPPIKMFNFFLLGCFMALLTSCQKYDESVPLDSSENLLIGNLDDFSTNSPQQVLGRSDQAIIPVDPASLNCSVVEDFNSLPVFVFIDHVLVLGPVSAAERFAGQTLIAGTFDELIGTPTNPLTLVAGAPEQNLFTNNQGGTISLAGEAASSELGEGAVSFLFDSEMSEVGIDIAGGNGGTAVFTFFARDGSPIDTESVTGLPIPFTSYAFRRDGNISDIAGFSITNNDFQGITYDNLRFCVGINPDIDNDGCLDVDDAHPNSNQDEFVTINDCDSGVLNVLDTNTCGSTFMDIIQDCQNSATNHGEFVSCVTAASTSWLQSGQITGHQKGVIQSCSALSSIP